MGMTVIYNAWIPLGVMIMVLPHSQVVMSLSPARAIVMASLDKAHQSTLPLHLNVNVEH